MEYLLYLYGYAIYLFLDLLRPMRYQTMRAFTIRVAMLILSIVFFYIHLDQEQEVKFWLMLR